MGVNNDTIVEVKILYTVNEQQLMNVVHYTPSIPVAGPEEGILDNFMTSFGDTGAGTLLKGMRQLQSNQVVYDETTAQIVFPTRFAVRHYDSALEGLVDVACDRQNTGITVSKKGRLGNRHNLGSFHLGGVANTVFKEGGFNLADFAPQIGALETGVLHTYVDDLNGTTWVPVILNKQKIEGSDPVRYEISGKTQVVETQAGLSARVMYRRTVRIGI